MTTNNFSSEEDSVQMNQVDGIEMSDEQLQVSYRVKNLGYLITTRCNKLCKYCGLLIPDKADKEDTTYEEFYNSLVCTPAILKESGKTVVLTGGEPFLHPDIDKILKDCLEWYPNSKVLVITNGKLFPPHDHLLDELGERLHIRISEYPGWNDDIVTRYKDSSPNIIIPKYSKFFKPEMDMNISEEKARKRLKICGSSGAIRIYKDRAYYCCMGEAIERVHNVNMGVPVTKSWWDDMLKLEFWAGCAVCPIGRLGLGYTEGLYDKPSSCGHDKSII